MKVYFDNIIFSLQKAGGISIYWYELLKRGLTDNNLNVNIIENKHIGQNIFRRQLNLAGKYLIEDNRFPVKLLRYLPIFKKLAPGAILHSSYYRTLRQKDVVKIVTVYDFIYERYVSGLPALVHSRQKKRAVSQADGIICISESTRKDLFQYYPHIDPAKVAVVHVGVGEEFFPVQDSPETQALLKEQELDRQRYIIFIGSRATYKNFRLAVEAVALTAAYKLLVIGGGPLNKEEKEMLESRLSGRYNWLDKVAGENLNVLYNFAHCLLYPSNYEGFGIPPAESMKAGCPVIARNTSSIPEVVGNAGLLFDDPEVQEILRLIKELENAATRKQVVEEGLLQAKRFSWDNCYNETINFYGKVRQRKFGN